MRKSAFFYIHNDAGMFMEKIQGYNSALQTIKGKKYNAQLSYPDKENFVLVYAHVPEKLKLSQMSSNMLRQKLI